MLFNIIKNLSTIIVNWHANGIKQNGNTFAVNVHVPRIPTNNILENIIVVKYKFCPSFV